MGFKFPGVVWTALLVALPLFAVWLEQYFSGAIWAAPIAGLLLIVAKVVEVLKDSAQEPLVDAELEMAALAVEREPRSLWWG